MHATGVSSVYSIQQRCLLSLCELLFQQHHLPRRIVGTTFRQSETACSVKKSHSLLCVRTAHVLFQKDSELGSSSKRPPSAVKVTRLPTKASNLKHELGSCSSSRFACSSFSGTKLQKKTVVRSFSTWLQKKKNIFCDPCLSDLHFVTDFLPKSIGFISTSGVVCKSN